MTSVGAGERAADSALPGRLGSRLSKSTTAVLSQLRSFLAAQKVKAYLVGGFVRDLFLGRETQDVDIAVKGDALLLGQHLATRLKGVFVPLGEHHATVRVVLFTHGRRWHVDLSSFAEDIERDLARRDFTLNAMAIDLETGELLDPFQGRQDLERGVLRALGEQALEGDPIRLLRAVRLCAQLGLQMDAETRNLISRIAPRLAAVAPERVREEFLKTISQRHAPRWLKLMQDLGLLFQVLPELESCRGVEQPEEHYWDVLDHSLQTVGAVEVVLERGQRPEAGEALLTSDPCSLGPFLDLIPWDPSLEGYFQREASDGHSRLTLIKVAGLLHDIAKPFTKTRDSTGRIRFLGHQKEGAAIAERALKRLRFSKQGVRLVSAMIAHHLRPTQMAQKGELPTQRAIYRFFREVGEVAVDTLYLNLADYLGARGPLLGLEEWRHHTRLIGYILETGLHQGQPEALPKLINGHDLINLFGLKPGPELGALLREVQEAQGVGEVSTREEALNFVQERLKGASR